MTYVSVSVGSKKLTDIKTVTFCFVLVIFDLDIALTKKNIPALKNKY
tara:strand:+ start:357 stop:497 length:141 start_codon:yes stop_codon:yes gene_type:complete